MGKMLGRISIGLSISFCHIAGAATWYVDVNVPSSGDGKTLETAFKTIQEGIDAASDRDTVIVAQGTYLENIQFNGKNITLRSTDPLDPQVVAGTVIDGGRNGPVVTFSGSESEGCTLSGFTIQHGRADFGGGVCGGYWSQGTRATIQNNVIRANVGFFGAGLQGLAGDGPGTVVPLHEPGWGGGLAYCKGMIEGNTIIENFARRGGGLYACNGTVQNNIIAWNTGEEQGGGLYQCTGTVRDNTIASNVAGDGGGLALCSGTIEQNAICDNLAGGNGGGLQECSGTIRANLIAGNQARNVGGGLHSCQGPIEANTIRENSSYSGGGLYFCNKSIEGNTISGNIAETYGGGFFDCDGLIRNNVIVANVAKGRSGSGGGLHSCDGTIENNRITKNMADQYGGGLSRCAGVIQNNVISENSTTGSWGIGGGLDNCDGSVRNNVIARNSAGDAGGALAGCDGTVENCTIYGNSANHGSGLSRCLGTITNCIIWGNKGRPQIESSSVPSYSCIEASAGGGVGNIGFYPYFVDAENGDFHLRSWSPCIDAGDPGSPFSNEPEPNGGRINMGAYGNTPEAAPKSPDTDADGLPDEWEMHWFGSLQKDAAEDPDNDRISNATEYRFAWDPTCATEARVNNLSKATWYPTVQAALAESGDGDTIALLPGVYLENISFCGKNVILRSMNPSDPAVVAGTIIDGSNAGSVITFSGTETEACVLAGLTIQNGNGRDGGGISGGTRDLHTEATVLGNIIIGNSARDEGGGLAYCDGSIRANVVRGNVADHGGGVYECNGPIRGNTIIENVARGDGGGLYGCDGSVQENTVSQNKAGHGGGLSSCQGLIESNTISLNTAEYGGGLSFCNGTIRRNVIAANSAESASAMFGASGGGLNDCRGTISNNLVCGNVARGLAGEVSAFGGGLSYCRGLVESNTIVANRADDEGGGFYGFVGIIHNCIVWGNESKDGAQLSYDPWQHNPPLPTFSCIQSWSGGGEGNIAPPSAGFLDADGPDDDPRTWEDNDYRLGIESPCIDAGENEEWMWEGLDLDGNPRVWRGEVSLTVDMGAHEFGSFPFKIVEAAMPPGAGPQLTWNSRTGDTYTVWSCLDLLSGEWTKEESIPSQGQTTTWTDAGAAPSRKFYKVQIE